MNLELGIIHTMGGNFQFVKVNSMPELHPILGHFHLNPMPQCCPLLSRLSRLTRMDLIPQIDRYGYHTLVIPKEIGVMLTTLKYFCLHHYPLTVVLKCCLIRNKCTFARHMPASFTSPYQKSWYKRRVYLTFRQTKARQRLFPLRRNSEHHWLRMTKVEHSKNPSISYLFKRTLILCWVLPQYILNTYKFPIITKRVSRLYAIVDIIYKLQLWYSTYNQIYMHTTECKCRYHNCSLYIMSTIAYKRLTLLVMMLFRRRPWIVPHISDALRLWP